MSEARNDNFFSNLRKTAQTTERGVRQLQNNLETKFTNRCSAAAVTKLIDLKKDAKELKEQARNCNLTLQKAGNEFDVFLSLAASLIHKQTDKFTDIQTFMSQYGYIHGEEEAPVVKQEDINEQENTDPQSHVLTPPCNTVSKSVSHTPKLEEFGLSQIMMKAINRAEKQGRYGFSTKLRCRVKMFLQELDHRFNFGIRAYLKPCCRCSESETSYTEVVNKFHHVSFPKATRFQYPLPCKWTRLLSEKTDLDNAVPSIFQHNGLVVTPSIMNGKMSTDTPALNRKTGHTNLNNSPCAPHRLEEMPIEPGSAKPDTPEFLTPFTKRMIHKGNANQPSHVNAELGSPELPVFMTPSMNKRFQKEHLENSTRKCRFETPPKMASLYSSSEMPQTPELTCNYQGLSDVMGTYMTRETKNAPMASMLSNIVKPPLSTNSFLEMPQTPELTCNFQKSLPAEPRLLADFRQSESKILTPEIESFSSTKEQPVVKSGKTVETIYAQYSTSNAPVTPQFHLNYR